MIELHWSTVVFLMGGAFFIGAAYELRRSKPQFDELTDIAERAIKLLKDEK